MAFEDIDDAISSYCFARLPNFTKHHLSISDGEVKLTEDDIKSSTKDHENAEKC